MHRKYRYFLGFLTAGVLLDQVTKLWVRGSAAIAQGGIDVIPHFFQLVHTENPGAAFGLLGDLPEAFRLGLFLVFTVVAVGVIIDLFRRLPNEDWFVSTTMGLILSGALGNGIDRLLKGTVTDFIRFYTDHPEWVPWLNANVGMAEYPSFNVADISLVVGVALFMIHYLFLDDSDAPSQVGSTPDAQDTPQ